MLIPDTSKFYHVHVVLYLLLILQLTSNTNVKSFTYCKSLLFQEMHKRALVKVTTIIAGIPDDYFFSHACYVAENLARILPNFHFKRICKSNFEWESWLQEICKRHGWVHVESPLIWREIGITGNKVTYIGGAHQFWKLLHEYYNINPNIKDEDLEALKLDTLFTCNIESKSAVFKEHEKRRCITIIGAGTSMCFELVPQLIMTKQLWLSHGVLVNLYDVPGHYFKLKKIAKDAQVVGGGLQSARIIEDISVGLIDCDILLYLDHLTREENEGTESWLNRNYALMKILADEINIYAPDHMKVIFCSMGPTCFYANVLQYLTDKLPKSNIVAVSAHYGLEIIYPFVNSLNFDMQEFNCPPVWGFLGINKLVDVCHLIQKHDIYRANNAVSNVNESMTLRSDTKKYSEMRWFLYMSYDKNPYKDYTERKAIAQYQMGRVEDFQKCKAICDLLKIWYSDIEKTAGDEIISLGICSNGTFGIPEGIFFSQPVHLQILNDKSRVWVPFADFPIPNMSTAIFENLILTAVHIVDDFIKLQHRAEICSSG